MKYLALILSLLFSASLVGQDKGYNVDKTVEKLSKLYNLTDAQKSQFKPILEAKLKVYSDMLEKSQKSTKKDIDQKKIIEADNTYQKSVLAILDEDQKKAFINHQRISKGLIQSDKVMTQDEVKTLSGSKVKSANQ